MATHLLTVTEAAEVLRVSPYTLRRWVRQGKVPAFQSQAKGAIRIHPDDLTALRKQPA